MLRSPLFPNCSLGAVATLALLHDWRACLAFEIPERAPDQALGSCAPCAGLTCCRFLGLNEQKLRRLPET